MKEVKPSCSLWLARALSCVPWDELLESVAEMHSPILEQLSVPGES